MSISEEMQKIFGINGEGTDYFSSKTAYMLFYRKIEKT